MDEFGGRAARRGEAHGQDPGTPKKRNRPARPQQPVQRRKRRQCRPARESPDVQAGRPAEAGGPADHGCRCSVPFANGYRPDETFRRQRGAIPPPVAVALRDPFPVPTPRDSMHDRLVAGSIGHDVADAERFERHGRQLNPISFRQRPAHAGAAAWSGNAAKTNSGKRCRAIPFRILYRMVDHVPNARRFVNAELASANPTYWPEDGSLAPSGAVDPLSGNIVE